MHQLSFWQKFGLWVVGFMLSTAVGLFIFAQVINQTILNREFVGNILTSNSTFELVRAGAEEQFAKENDELVQNSPEFQQIFQKYLDQDKFNSIIGQVNNSVFDWLDGKTSTINFDINLVDSKEEFRDFLRDAVVVHFNSLEVCKNAKQSQQAAIDLLEAKCRPQQFKAAKADELIKQNVSEKELDELYNKTRINDEALNIDLDENANRAAVAAQNFKKLPGFMAIMIIILCGAALAILRQRNSTMRFVGRNFLFPSVSILVITAIFYWVLKVPAKIVEQYHNNSPALAANTVTEFVNVIFGGIAPKILLYTGGFFVVGLALYLTGRFGYKAHTEPTFASEPNAIDKAPPEA